MVCARFPLFLLCSVSWLACPAFLAPARAQAPISSDGADQTQGRPGAAAGSTAAAASGDEQLEPNEYRALIDEAVREAAAQNYEEARSLFLRAHALFPSARTYRGLGMSEFELRNYPASIEQLEAALTSKVRPLDATLRRDVEQLLVRARRFVGLLVIETKPAASELRVDKLPVSRVAGEALTVKIGEHVLEALADGYALEERHISVKGGEVARVSIVFQRPLQGLAQASERRWYKSPWLWTAVGVLVAGGATAVALVTTSGSDSTAAPYPGNLVPLGAP